MTTSEEIKLFKVAKKLLKESYGLNCKTFNKDCIDCRAQAAYAFINNHIKILEMK
jgi:hypothetical protein